MNISIIQTTTKTFTQDRQLLASRVNEAYLLEPEPGKVIRQKSTGKIFYHSLCIDKERKLADYEEIIRKEES